MPEYRNRFASPQFIEEKIIGREGTIGIVRIKPSSILWKPKGEQKFYCVTLDRFADWIMSPTCGAQRINR